MKHWIYEDLRSGVAVPDRILAVAERTLLSLRPYAARSGPRLVRIGGRDDPGDACAYEVRLELAPGVLIDVRSGLPNGGGGDAETDVSRGIDETLGACMPHVVRLADIVHMARLRARRVVAGWHDDGVHSDVVGVQLAPYDGWRGTAGPKLVVHLRGLDRLGLEPQIREIHVETLTSLDRRLSEYGRELKDLQSERTHFLRLGATGTVTQLVLNAIGTLGDEEATLRRLASEPSFRLPDGSLIRAVNGRVGIVGGVRQRLEWSGDELTIHSPSMPAADAFGRSVTEIVEHGYLTADMLVAEAADEFVDGSQCLKVKLDMPVWLFCSVSGRAWRNNGSIDAMSMPVRSPTTASVVPFPERRR